MHRSTPTRRLLALAVASVAALSCTSDKHSASLRNTDDGGPSPSEEPTGAYGSDAGDDPIVDGSESDGGLLPISPSGDQVTVGPAGGLADFESGLRIEVPRGALSEETTLKVTMGDVASVDVPSGAVLAVVHLEPSGAVFGAPVVVTVPSGRLGALDNDARQRVIAVSLPAAAGDDGNPGDLADDAGVVDHELPEAEVLKTEFTSAGDLRAEHWHFTDQVVLGPSRDDVPLSVLKTFSGIRNYATAWTARLSLQILGIIQQEDESALVHPPLVLTNLRLRDPMGGWLQPGAASDLGIAAAAANRPIQVNYSWRSLAVQYLIAGTAGGSTAAVGTSTHGLGLAVDLQSPWVAFSDECYARVESIGAPHTLLEAEQFFPGVATPLSAAHYNWWGINARHDQCSDPVHFTYQRGDASSPLRTLNVSAFQTLWNHNNPCAVIKDAAGELGPDTTARLGSSRAGGFALIKNDPRADPTNDLAPVLPAEGIEGAGCQGGPDGKMCCPKDATHDGPYCADSCEASWKCILQYNYCQCLFNNGPKLVDVMHPARCPDSAIDFGPLNCCAGDSTTCTCTTGGEDPIACQRKLGESPRVESCPPPGSH